jgi:hypothetical protein
VRDTYGCGLYSIGGMKKSAYLCRKFVKIMFEFKDIRNILVPIMIIGAILMILRLFIDQEKILFVGLTVFLYGALMLLVLYLIDRDVNRSEKKGKRDDLNNIPDDKS